MRLSVQPLCSLCLCGELLKSFYHRDTETGEIAQSRMSFRASLKEAERSWQSKSLIRT